MNASSNTHKSRVGEITATLRDEILTGQYRAGERLPSERDLAARFESNRGAVREALKKLEQMGIADITPGGVRVVPVEDATLDVLGYIMDLQEMPDPVLVGQVFEVLGALMSMSARTAIRSADDAQVAEIMAVVERLIADDRDPERNQQNWKELGRLFTSINNNLVLRLILNGLKTQFVGRLEAAGPEIDLDRDKNREILKEMAAGLRARDSRRVAEAIDSHFGLLRTTVTTALAAATINERSVSHA